MKEKFTNVHAIVADNLEPEWVHEEEEECSRCKDCKYLHIEESKGEIAFCINMELFLTKDEFEMYECDGDYCTEFEEGY